MAAATIRSISMKKAPRPMSEYWSGGGLTRKMGATIRKTPVAEDEQVLEGLVSPEGSHGHGLGG